MMKGEAGIENVLIEEIYLYFWEYIFSGVAKSKGENFCQAWILEHSLWKKQWAVK